MKRVLKTIYAISLVLLVSCFLPQCKGGSEPVLGDIIGPDAIGEYSSVEYSISANNFTGALFTWTVNPPHAGEFETPEATKTKFISAGIDADLPIEISVVITSDQSGAVIKKKSATIKNHTGYAYSWGGTGSDTGEEVASDKDNNLYVVGYYSDMVDLDPGPGVDIRTGYGSYLAKYDAEGAYRWGHIWEDSHYDLFINGLTIDGKGDIYITGYFILTIDFDPGPGVDERTSNGSYDVFLSKFDMYGNHLWTLTWGGLGMDEGRHVMSDNNGNVFVTGAWASTVDFDPGPGVDEREYIGSSDGFLSRFDPSGNRVWTATWGGYGYHCGYSVAEDNMGDLYIAGTASAFTDLDPGPDIAGFDCNNHADVTLTKLNMDGVYLWGRTWGGQRYDKGYDVAVDDSGNVYVSGEFAVTVDFDPGPMVDEHTATSYIDVFLSKFNPEGDFQWALTWGGGSHNRAAGLAIDMMDYIYVAGTFRGVVDFDPGIGADEHYGPDIDSGFLSKFNSSGYYQWVKTWDGTPYDMATDYRNSAYVVGRYSATADLTPGPVYEPRVASGLYDAYMSRFPTDGDW